MALQKQIEKDNTGIVNEYWRIGRVNLSIIDGNVELFMHGYPSKTLRDNLKNADDVITKTYREEDYTNEVVTAIDALLAALYGMRKESEVEIRDTGEVDKDGNAITEEVETNVFADAVDVFEE